MYPVCIPKTKSVYPVLVWIHSISRFALQYVQDKWPASIPEHHCWHMFKKYAFNNVRAMLAPMVRGVNCAVGFTRECCQSSKG